MQAAIVEPGAADWLGSVPLSDAWRRESPAQLLARLAGARRSAGITRTAELTYLDRIGLPVFQAIRPMGRALSVHQGKGPDNATAELSAVMEAIESSAAESVAPTGPTCSFDALPRRERAGTFANYGECDGRRPVAADAVIRWLEAEDFVGRRRFFVPFDVVSQDFTFDGDSPFVRSSLGLGAGACADDATMAALFELVERDAQAHWLASGMIGQANVRVDPATIDVDWFQELSERMRGLGLRLSVYAVAGAGRLPVVLCRIDDPGYAPSFLGAACRADPYDALFRAFAEAAQSRLTVISGTRDDIAPDEPTQAGSRALGTPPGREAVDWRGYRDGFAVPLAIPDICARLVSDGFDEIAWLDISPPCGDVAVVKIIVPGLAGSPECLG